VMIITSGMSYLSRYVVGTANPISYDNIPT
jgi:hypothetical protein